MAMRLSLIALLVGALASVCAGSTPDREQGGTDMALAGNTHGDTALRMDPHGLSGFPESGDYAYPLESEDRSWFREFVLSPAKLSSQYEFSHKIESPSEVRNHRTSFRLEYSKFLLEHFYLRADTKLSVFLPNDHRTRSTTLWINDEPSREEVSLGTFAREAYLQASLGTVSLKAGIQVPAWGEFEFIPVTDEISPQDFREPLVISLDELRLGQPMAILDQYSWLGNVSAFLVPYPLFNEHPREGTGYYFDPFMGGVQVSEEDRDPWEMEYGVRWKCNFDKTDVSVVAARLLANERYFSMAGPGKFRTGAQAYLLAGASLNHALKKVLLKAEFAAKLPRAYMDEGFAKVERQVLDGALGLTYNWDASTTFTFESANSHVLDWSSRLQGVPRDSYTLVGMLRRQFLNDDLSLTWISIYTGPYTTYFHTLSAAYLWNDWITLSGEALWPDPDDRRSAAWHLRGQKQLAFRIKHQF